MNFEQIEQKVIEWAEARSIFNDSSADQQLDKLFEEFNELCDHIEDGASFELIKDDIGDMIVVLTLIAKFKGTSLTQCYELAYNEIKDRRGKMINGLFVKEQ